MNGKLLGEQYSRHFSDFQDWKQLDNAVDWILFKQNIGPHLSIDEVALAQGEPYTVVINKSGKGQKGTLVAMVSGTVSDRVIEVLKKIPKRDRYGVWGITLDMPHYGTHGQGILSKSSKGIDRFHVQKLAHGALQEIRIKYR